MRIFNADGGEVESCGNAARCVARWLMDEKDATGVRIVVAGRPAGLPRSRARACVSVDMGAPQFDWDEIPLAEPADTNGFDLDVGGRDYRVSAVSVGNPHCVVFVDDVEAGAAGRDRPAIRASHDVPGPDQHRIRAGAVARTPAHAGVGTRRRHHARLRHRRLRSRRRRPSPRSGGAQGRCRARWRHARASNGAPATATSS